MAFRLPPLPPAHDLETQAVLRKAASAHRYLAELKGLSRSIPNQGVLISTLGLQEAKDSSAIENIVTTHDELYRESLFPDMANAVAAKEVRRYARSLQLGYEWVRDTGLLTTRHLVTIQTELVNNSAGIRRLPGTSLVNDQSGEVIYVPPQEPAVIDELMLNLDRYINDDGMAPADPLVRMAIIHYQLESIHPFYDGNGRAGRILNVLYLVRSGLLDIPVLYLSREIIRTKAQYYRLLQGVRDADAWEQWILYMLGAVEVTARHTIGMVTQIAEALTEYKRAIRSRHRFYSQDLISSLFAQPYTKIACIERDLRVSRLTAARYLDALADDGLLAKQKVGRSNYYVNTALFAILAQSDRASRRP